MVKKATFYSEIFLELLIKNLHDTRPTSKKKFSLHKFGNPVYEKENQLVNTMKNTTNWHFVIPWILLLALRLNFLLGR